MIIMLLLIPNIELKYAIMMRIIRMMMLILMKTVPHPVSRLEVCRYDDNQDEDVDFDEDNASPRIPT